MRTTKPKLILTPMDIILIKECVEWTQANRDDRAANAHEELITALEAVLNEDMKLRYDPNGQGRELRFL